MGVSRTICWSGWQNPFEANVTFLSVFGYIQVTIPCDPSHEFLILREVECGRSLEAWKCNGLFSSLFSVLRTCLVFLLSDPCVRHHAFSCVLLSHFFPKWVKYYPSFHLFEIFPYHKNLDSVFICACVIKFQGPWRPLLVPTLLDKRRSRPTSLLDKRRSRPTSLVDKRRSRPTSEKRRQHGLQGLSQTDNTACTAWVKMNRTDTACRAWIKQTRLAGPESNRHGLQGRMEWTLVQTEWNGHSLQGWRRPNNIVHKDRCPTIWSPKARVRFAQPPIVVQERASPRASLSFRTVWQGHIY